MSPPRLRLVAESTPAPGLRDRSDDELMRLAQAGLRDAFAALVERHAQLVVNVCAKFVNDVELGEELAQDTWAGIYAERAKYRAEGRFLHFLLAAARNRCRNHFRRRGIARRFLASHANAPLEPGTADPIERLLEAERAARVHDALARLPAPMREALVLRYAEELRYDEIAAVLEVGESTLRSRVHHGLRMLRELLEKRR